MRPENERNARSLHRSRPERRLIERVVGALVANRFPVRAKQQIDDLKAQVPDSVKDDLTVIGDGVTGASSDPMKLAEFYSSPEFTAANENVTKYLTVECSTVGS